MTSERAGNDGPHNDIAAVHRLMRMCREGTFFGDYDLSLNVLGDAESAMSRLVDRLIYGTVVSGLATSDESITGGPETTP